MILDQGLVGNRVADHHELNPIYGKGAMKTETLHIVDKGRGPQLSSCRITVQDLLPYYKEGALNEEIHRWIPSLSDDEIALLKDYIREHLEEVLQAEKTIKEYHERMRARQPAWARANNALSLEERRAISCYR